MQDFYQFGFKYKLLQSIPIHIIVHVRLFPCLSLLCRNTKTLPNITL